MSQARYVVYEESTPAPLWVVVLVWGAASLPALIGSGIGFTLLLVPLFFHLLFGQMTVRVTHTSLRVSFGYLPLITRLIPFSDIVDMEAVTYRPLREFGGWGIRFGGKGKRAWTMRGDRALVLKLEDGISFYVGSEHPERLAERIRAARSSAAERGGESGEEPPSAGDPSPEGEVD